jgi:hypothetical protein
MEKTNEATPRPWTYEERCSGIVIIPKDLDDETIISSIIPDDEDDECTDQQEANAELIVKAVNAYDSLVAEVERLKKVADEVYNWDIYKEKTQLQNENQKLREALDETIEVINLEPDLTGELLINKIKSLLKAKNV